MQENASNKFTKHRRSFYNNSRYYQNSRDYNKQGLNFYYDFLQPGITVEIGCGPQIVPTLFNKYIGVDLSLMALKMKGGMRVCADWMALPFQSESIDNIFSNATLEHVPDPALAIRESVRVIKPGGVIVHNDAWFCRPWTASGITVKTWRVCSFREKLFKLTILLRNSRLYRGLFVIPKRLFREITVLLKGKNYKLDYKRLKPNLTEPVTSDSDAFAHIDPHAVVLFYKSRGFIIIKPGNTVWNRLFYSGYVVCQKEKKN